MYNLTIDMMMINATLLPFFDYKNVKFYMRQYITINCSTLLFETKFFSIPIIFQIVMEIKKN